MTALDDVRTHLEKCITSLEAARRAGVPSEMLDRMGDHVARMSASVAAAERNAEYERIMALPFDDPERIKAEALLERIATELLEEEEAA